MSVQQFLERIVNNKASPTFLPFALPDIGEEEIAEVVDSLRGGWITTGPKTKRFEEDFVRYLGGGVHAVAMNSATAGLHLALEAVGIKAGDEVITTTHTFTASAEIIRYFGADPVFVDIDPETYCIDAKAAEAAITAKSRAIIPVHYAGLACDMSQILDIASRHGLAVVEDAAHSFPTLYRGRMIGTLESDCTVFSFYATKTLATGEGGMLVTRDPQIAARARVMRLHGIDRDAFDRYTSKRPAWYYQVVAPGFKYNMTDLAASLGIHQLRKVEAFRARRAELAGRYDRELSDLPLRLPPDAPKDGQHAWHLYVVQVTDDAPVGRDELIRRMSEAGICCSVHYIPLHQHPYWRERYHLRPDQFPHSQGLYECSVSLPLYTKMSNSDQTRVIRALRSILGK
jgi:dTDP-4-amino-4,6-dideoxygalactose transaminase